MQPASNVGRLNTADWESVQDHVTRFEDACQGGAIADLEQFLPPAGNPMRVLALNELIKSDLEIHWKRRKAITLEDYLKRFAELKARPNDWPKLLLEEFRVRQKFGDKPVLGSYQKRFPEQFRVLEQMITESAGTATVAHAPGTAPVPPPKPPPVAAGAEQATAPPARKAPPEPAAKGNRAPPDVGNGYTCLKALGSGTFGQVWRAEAPGGVPAAVAEFIFRPYDHEEAQRELQALEKIKSLRHPFLTATQAFWQAGDKLCIAMDLCDGSLRDRAKECRPTGGIPVPELLGYFKEAAEALDYLHSQDLLHRDIKPDNLLLVKPAVKAQAANDQSQRPTLAPGGVRTHLKLGDFGLVRIFESQKMQASGAGTPAYMPPEVWNGQVSKHSDQYSLAITYAELRRGKAVFSGTNMYELMVECLSKDPDLSGLEANEQEVLRKALTKDPTKRYESCWEFANALDQAFAPPPPPPVVPPPRPDPGPEGDESDYGTIIVKDSRGSKPSWKQDTAPIAGHSTADLPTRSFLPTLLLILAACVPVGFLVYQFLPPSNVVIPPPGPPQEPSYRLESPGQFPVSAGDTALLTIRVDRHNEYKEAVHLTFSGFPKGVTLPDQIVPGDKREVHVEVKADIDAQTGDQTVKVSAVGPGKKQEVTFTLKVLPSSLVFRREDGWVKVDGATFKKDATGRSFYDMIDVERDGIRVRFRRILQKAEDTREIPTFYIMENKVSVAQFKHFAATNPTLVKSMKWQEPGGVGGDYPKDDLPVFNVPVYEAYAFAQWLGGKKGKLPSIDQWDKAAGRFENNAGEGPFQGKWTKDKPLKIAVGRGDKGPMPCGTANDDISPFGCRDMAGNGREWTRTMDNPEHKMPLPPQQSGNALVFLRGHTFRGAWGPLMFDELSQNTSTGFYREADPETGFRAVIEP